MLYLFLVLLISAIKATATDNAAADTPAMTLRIDEFEVSGVVVGGGEEVVYGIAVGVGISGLEVADGGGAEVEVGPIEGPPKA